MSNMNGIEHLESISWDTHFTKGWTDEGLWRDYMQARDAKDFFEMDCIIRAEGAERPPEDGRIYSTNSKDIDLYEMYQTVPDAFASAQRDEEHLQLEMLVQLRDTPLDRLPNELPESLRVNSYFADLIKIDPYVPGVDFMTTMEEYNSVQAGQKPVAVNERVGILRTPETGRDWATYVHKDNPMDMWVAVVRELWRLGVPMRLDTSGNTIDRADGAFVTGGMPFWWALIGDVIGRIGPLNFRTKHEHMAARPEEYGVKRFNRLLPMTFAEGSPMHGTFLAMHDAIARAIAAAVLAMFDNYFILPSGNTVKYEINLLAGNISDGRQWAGVHNQQDNRYGNARAEVLGQRCAEEALATLTV